MTRFYVRGGAKWRKVYTKIERAKAAKYVCPACSKQSVVRHGIGMWQCKSCGAEFAGGAYEFSTPAGKLAQRLIYDLSKKGGVTQAEMEEIENVFEEVEEVPSQSQSQEVNEEKV